MGNRHTEQDALFVKKLIDQYREYDRTHDNVGIAPVENLTIRSVVQLTPGEKEQIVDLFVRMIDRPLGEIQEIIDPNLICGVSIQSESHYFEISGRQQLKKIKSAFYREL